MDKIKFDFSSLNFSGFGGNQNDEDETDEVKEFVSLARPAILRIVNYSNAQKLARDLDKDHDYFCLVAGSFVFGDFIEAFCEQHDLRPKTIYISTLGLKDENVDSIVNLNMMYGAAVRLIVSQYYVAHERYHKIPYMIQEFSGLDIQVAVFANHTKICLIETDSDVYVLAGSANLSSSDNLENFIFFHDRGVFDFCKRVFDDALAKWTIIDGSTSTTIFENNKNNRQKNIDKLIGVE